MKNIVVPVDYSENSLNALDYATHIAEKAHARITLFHSYHLPVLMPESVLTIDENIIRKEHLKKLKSFANKYKNLDIKFEVSLGAASDEVIKLAENNKVDLIVMGMRGIGKISRFLFGSTTVSVIKKTIIPLLVVPHQYHYRNIGKIILATDNYCWNEIIPSDILKIIHRYYGPKIFVLNFNGYFQLSATEKEKTASRINQILPDIDYKLFHKEEDDIVNGIKEFAKEKKVDLIVMVPRRQSFIHTMIKGSSSDEMAYESPVPVLFMPRQKFDKNQS